MKLKSSKIVACIALTLLALGGALGAVKVADSGQAYAASSLEYRVDPTTAAGGVYARYGPRTKETNSIVGYGVYPNQVVSLLCGVTNGDPVGPYNNRTWHFITDLSNTGEGNFWLNDHYVDSPNVANQLAPGESRCVNETVNPLFVTPSSGFTRTFAASYAIANGMGTPPARASCTWFVSNSLWAGGLAKTKKWTDAGQLGSSLPSKVLKALGLSTNLPGTIDAWNVQDFLAYIKKTYPTTTEAINFSTPNNVPNGAQIGDLVYYDWGQGEGWSHVAIVTLIDPNGLEVSDWSTNAKNGKLPSPVIMRRVAYSAVNHGWLQAECPNVKAELLHLEI